MCSNHEQIVFYHKEKKLFLCSNKTVYIPKLNILVLTDLHLGKTSHLRKNAIPIPSFSKNKDLETLQTILSCKKKYKVIFLGDIFHSEINAEWYAFKKILKLNSHHVYHLVEGNHDVLHRYEYKSANIYVHKNYLAIEDFLFSHEPIKDLNHQFLNICGHIHPGCLLIDKAKNTIKLSCFYYQDNCLILPAFGILTGLKILPKPKNGKVFPIFRNKIYELNFEKIH
jgi:DNA ligase-associated metallophosphoesterase